MERKYPHTEELLPEIKELLTCGMTQKEAEDRLDSTGCPGRELRATRCREHMTNFSRK